MTIKFKNTDVRWGAGIGRLPSLTVDENFYELRTRVETLEAAPPEAVSVDHVSWDSVNNTISIVLTDGYTFGPFTLPAAKFTVVAWTPLTVFPVNTFVTEGGSTYLVEFPHTSAATFDPGANDGLGHNYYGLLPFPTPPTIEWLEDGWIASATMGAFKLFSVPDQGLYLSLRAHVNGTTFDPDAVSDTNLPLYQKIFDAIETNIARIQFQYPGRPPSDGSIILVYLNDDARDLVFDGDWANCLCHLNEACTDTIEWTLQHLGVDIGAITFEPGELLDGEGGQYGVFTGAGVTIGTTEMLKLAAPGYADATAMFLTVALRGTYEDPS
jgi:hypothetical protein